MSEKNNTISTMSRKRPLPGGNNSGIESPTDSTTCSDLGDYNTPETKIAKRYKMITMFLFQAEFLLN